MKFYFKKKKETRPESEIIEFVKKFNVKFDMFSRVNVNGDDALPLFKYLKAKIPDYIGTDIKWNFAKFLVNRKGVPVKRFVLKNLSLSIFLHY